MARGKEHGLEPHQIGAAGLNAYVWARAWRLARWVERILATGKPLDETTKSQMEGFFGRNLEDVRIHDSHLAGEVARKLGAEAFAYGNRIFADKERFNLQTPEGLGLLAHELTHVIQQTQPQPLPPYSNAAPRPVPSGEHGIITGRRNAHVAGYSLPSSSTVQRDTEAEAQASEQAISQAAEGVEQVIAVPEIDIDALADMVYRLMRRDLVLERERVVSIK